MKAITQGKIRLILLTCIIGAVIALAACGTGGQTQAPQTPQPRQAALQIVPQSGLAGATVAYYGAGFLEGEQVNLEIIKASLKNGVVDLHVGPEAALVVANASGAWSSAAWSSPPAIAIGLAPGTYTLKATGNKGSLATAPIIVLPPPAKK